MINNNCNCALVISAQGAAGWSLVRNPSLRITGGKQKKKLINSRQFFVLDVMQGCCLTVTRGASFASVATKFLNE